MTTVNYTACGQCPYEEHPDPVVTTLSCVWFEGNCQAYIEDMKERKGPDADQLARVTYRTSVMG